MGVGIEFWIHLSKGPCKACGLSWKGLRACKLEMYILGSFGKYQGLLYYSYLYYSCFFSEGKLLLYTLPWSS